MNEITELYYNALLELGIKPELVPEVAGFRLVGRDGKYYYIRLGGVPINDMVSAFVGDNKYCTNRLLHREGIPVPECTSYTREEFEEDPEMDHVSMRFPVVVKPGWGTSTGQDVFCNIPDKPTLIKYTIKLLKIYDFISIEKYEPDLRSYRLLILKDKVIGLVERTPAHVIGDGRHTIAELIKLENEKRKKIKGKLPWYDFELNEETERLLSLQNMQLDDIPWPEAKVILRFVCNTSRGGTSISYDARIVHKSIENVAARAAKILGVKLVGFDFLCEDISAPINEQRSFFIEANTNPDITIHEYDINGTPVKVAKMIMKTFLKEYIDIDYRGRLSITKILVYGCLAAFIAYIIFIIIGAVS